MSDNNLDQIGGSKGGKGGGNPSTAKDNLDSIAKIKILDALGEGDIDGFATARSIGLSQSDTLYNTALLKDIFFDNTPVLAETASVATPSDDDFNFDDITIGHRRGTGTQSVLQGFAATQTEVSVNRPVTKTGADSEPTEQIDDASDTIDRIRFTINFPALQKFENDGDIVGSKAEYKFLISYDNADFINMSIEELGEDKTFSTSGRSGDLYQRSYGFKLRDAGYTSNIRIRIKRITNDSGTKTQNAFSWFSYTKIKFDGNRYLNTALVSIQTTAEQFSSMPVRNYRVRGLRTRIPNTGTVATGTGKVAGRITYSGTWPGAGANGTSNFTNTWHSDPAWVLWDLLTEERYGLGIDPTTLDEFSFLAISQYNNELVSDRVPAPTAISGTGTYAQSSSTTITITSTNHGLATNFFVNLNFTSGGQSDGGDGEYQITKLGANVFTVTVDTSGTSSGNVSFSTNDLKFGTWTQTANKTFVEVTSIDGNTPPNEISHNLSGRDFLVCKFRGANPRPADGTYKVKKTGRKTFQLLNVSSIASTQTGIVSFTRENTEVRFAFNGVINKEHRAFDLINAVCSSMRVMPFWSAGTVTLIQDKPATQTSGSYTANGEVAPAFIFSQANVEGGNFTYEGSDIKSRATLVAVKYFDMEQRKFARVQFPTKDNVASDSAITKYGIVKKEINAFACTSQGQAMRLAKWTRESEQLLTETVTFTVSIDSGIYIRPGQVIGISDRVRNGDFRRAGRVKAVQANTTDRINLDSDVTTSLYGYRTMTGTYTQSGTTITITNTNNSGNAVSHFYEIGAPITVDFTSGSAVDGNFTVVSVPSSTTFTITASSSATNSGNVTVTYRDTRMVSVVMPDNSVSRKEVNFLRKSDNLLDVVGSFENSEGTNTAPEVNTVWILEVISTAASRNLESDLFRVVSITESEGAKYKVSALTYNHSLYSAVDAGTDVEYRDATNIDAKPQRPTNLTTTESLYKETINQNADTDTTQKKTNKAKIKSMLALKWQAADGVANYKVMYRYANNNFRTEDVQGTTFELKNIKANRLYDFRVQSVSQGGKLSRKAALNNVLTEGKTAPPNPVTGLAVTVDPNMGLIITWNENEPDPDSFNGSNPDVLFKDLDIVGYDIHINKNNTDNIPDSNFGVTTGTFLTRVQAPDVELGIKNTKLLNSGVLGTVVFFIKARDDGKRYSDGSFVEGQNKVTFTPVTPHAPVIDASTSGVQIDTINIDFTTLRDSNGNADPNGTEIPANGFAIKHYEVLFNNKTIKIDTTGYTRPANYSGTKTFQIRTVDIAGNKSAYSSIDIEVKVGDVSFDTPEIDDGFVLLNWTYSPPSSPVLPIPVKEFHLKVGTPGQGGFSQATDLGKIQGDSLKVKQTVGTVRYFIKAIDVNGNKTLIAGTQDVTINPPELPSPYFDTPAITIDSELLTVTVDWLEYNPDLNFTGGFSLPLKHFRVKRATASNINNTTGTVQSFTNAKHRGNHMVTEFKEQIKRSNGAKENTFYRYYIQPKDIYNATGTVRSADITIERPNNITNLETEVIDNNVLLRFSDATNSNGLPIKHYEIKKSRQATNGSYQNYNSAELLGRIQGTFFVSFEDTSGDYRYYVRAVDVLGMESDDGFVDAVVDEPPDFTLVTDFKTDFDASTDPPSGLPTFISSSNFYVEDGVGYANVNTTETIQGHFIGTGSSSSPQFASPQAQIDAGFAYWLMPTETTAHFQEILNLGTNIKASLIKSRIQFDDIGSSDISPTLGFGSSITGSGSNTSIVNETSRQARNIYGTNFQYVRFRYDFEQTGGNDLLKIKQIRLRVEVKQRNDQGRGVALIGTANYTRSGTTITITRTNHGLAVGDGVGFDVTSGNATSGDYQVDTVPNANTFTVKDSASGTTNGAVDFDSNGSNQRGTPVFFNKTFVDIEAITATPNVNVTTALPLINTIVDFEDVADPTKFHVFLFNNSGGRIEGTFTWQCRGR